MYRISELAQQVGLSRTALLYYEKQGLIQGQRQANGYRLYSDQDLQRVRLIQKLQAGGLTLKECQACLDARIDRPLLQQRLQQLDQELAQKQQSRDLLAALLGQGDLKAWHESVDRVAPDAHLDWLMKQGFNEKEALRLKWLSKDMNEHEQYMADFMAAFETLDRWGPGSETETRRALSRVPHTPSAILEVGCGKGLATTILASDTQATITAVDNEPSALARLTEMLQQAGLAERVEPVCASMTDLPFEPGSFDLIWAEGSAYIMGVSKALSQWRPLLQDGGILMLSDMVWLTDERSEAAEAFFAQEYPDMQSVDTRLAQAEAAGYQVVDHFALSQAAWDNYYQPLKARLSELQPQMPDSAALKDIAREIAIYEQYLGQYGYQMMMLKKRD
ncbi:transcriptional regulator, MerR family [Ferrimonas balearica DSM 9799]|uniref:Transcriptional regulator, MerR family n=1 Tax=Ferrimonas balearica (strain DSM 9799 / CCM 4581 / KCTC 23876 / PAT) TaxID=550540 RepID=E1SS24_FERBD|nr:MerR family transcriptional regulator [Ferrimonas balearica]ADN75979.1 transcriptional regulator, MerR family [Ferrimonas balearica DSM 9799]